MHASRDGDVSAKEWRYLPGSDLTASRAACLGATPSHPSCSTDNSACASATLQCKPRDTYASKGVRRHVRLHRRERGRRSILSESSASRWIRSVVEGGARWRVVRDRYELLLAWPAIRAHLHSPSLPTRGPPQLQREHSPRVSPL